MKSDQELIKRALQIEQSETVEKLKKHFGQSAMYILKETSYLFNLMRDLCDIQARLAQDFKDVESIGVADTFEILKRSIPEDPTRTPGPPWPQCNHNMPLQTEVKTSTDRTYGPPLESK